MKGKKKGKLCICFIMILLIGMISGCEDIHFEESSEEGRQLIQDWLAYKKQMEDTAKFAENPPMKEQNNEQAQESEQAKQQVQKRPYIPTETETVVEGAVIQPLTEHGFYYSYLSDSLKVVYDEMLQSLLKMQKVTISTLSEEQADLAFRCVLYDHPEVFYVSGYQIIKKTMGGKTVELTFEGEYTLSKEEVAERQKQIEAYSHAFLSSLWDGMDEYTLVKYVYDYLITNTTYNLETADNQNICSVFIQGQSVCQGYAEATQYLLQKLGIEAAVVAGEVGQGNRHAWNIVKVNGAYYYMDTTWGDADYRIIDETGNRLEGQQAPINYDYFLVTTSQLEKTHKIEAVISMPVCVATQDNYYVREKLFFEGVDEARIAEAFQKAYAGGQSTVTLKAADDTAFAALKEYMITNQKVFQYVETSSAISYSEDAGMCTLCFWL